ncbi:MAG TPA: hypothetical protein VN174_04915 [Candidatus Methanoperedens sp.]|nr:hypothetical protein [Candidatus Methanoperedens sp.]
MKKRGMAAIITVVVLGAVMVMLGSMMILTSISDGQASLLETRVKSNQAVLDACAEESLLKLNANGVLPETVVTPLGNCSITTNSQVGTSWDYSIGISGEMSPLGLNIILDRGTTIVISTWIDE